MAVTAYLVIEFIFPPFVYGGREESQISLALNRHCHLSFMII